MKARRAIRVSLLAALCLLLGAATTVGVAWWAAWPSVPTNWLNARVDPAYLGPWVTLDETTTFGLSRLRERRFAPEMECRSRVAAGWPFRSLQSEHVAVAGRAKWSFLSWRQGVGLPATLDKDDYGLPCLPLPLGFGASTVLYAGAWGHLLLTPPMLYRITRSRLRASEGLCCSCGYDLTGSPGGACPECGHIAGAQA